MRCKTVTATFISWTSPTLKLVSNLEARSVDGRPGHNAPLQRQPGSLLHGVSPEQPGLELLAHPVLLCGEASVWEMAQGDNPFKATKEAHEETVRGNLQRTEEMGKEEKGW